MARKPAGSKLVSVSVLKTSPGCVDYVLRALESVLANHRLLFPVSDLHVQSPLTLGSVTVETFPRSVFEHLESKLPDGPSAVAHIQWCRSMRRDFQGSAVAVTSVFAEPIRAEEIAKVRVELAVAVLRFFAPAHLDQRVTSRVALWGYAPQRTDRVFRVDAAGRFLSTSGSIIDPPGTLTISDSTRDLFLGAGLSKLRDILASDSRTDLEQALLTGVVTFGRAAITSDPKERLIWYCAGLESVLLRDSNEPILHTLSERLAIFSYDNVAERRVAVKDVKDAYSARSRFLHHGAEIGEGEIVGRFARHGLRLFSRLAQNVDKLKRKVDLLDHIDRMKLSGSS